VPPRGAANASIGLIGQDVLRLRRALFHQSLANELAAQVTLQRLAVKNLMDAVGLHRSAKPELEWAAPLIGN